MQCQSSASVRFIVPHQEWYIYAYITYNYNIYTVQAAYCTSVYTVLYCTALVSKAQARRPNSHLVVSWRVLSVTFMATQRVAQRTRTESNERHSGGVPVGRRGAW